MHTGKLVFAQLMEHLPLTTFRRCVARYGGHHKVKRFSCLDQYLSMAFAQLTSELLTWFCEAQENLAFSGHRCGQ